jgi:hypothetical protein
MAGDRLRHAGGDAQMRRAGQDRGKRDRYLPAQKLGVDDPHALEADAFGQRGVFSQRGDRLGAPKGKAEPRAAYKQWIAGAVQPTGTIVVDDGAAKALQGGKSLLPAGVVAIDGTFERGDTIAVKSKDGRLLAKGLSAYASSDVAAIKGHKSEEIETLLGYRGRAEVIHRDDMVVES